jgi:ABC-2 type transport system ATP-binding protein
LADVERVCDTVAIIHEGALLLTANRDELLAQYAQNIVVLEMTANSVPSIPAFMADLEQVEWITAVSHQDNTIRLTVSDTATAKRDIFPLIAAHGLGMEKVEWKRPSLEEIFLNVSA